jgi:hypothetical protein
MFGCVFGVCLADFSDNAALFQIIAQKKDMPPYEQLLADFFC